MASATLIYSPQCPNCQRFIESLDRVPSGADVRRVDVNALDPAAYSRVTAVPTLVLPTGRALVGSDAFGWLKQFDSQVELGGWSGGGGRLAFSAIDGTSPLVDFAPRYGDFGN